jgi:hypothetical protein
MRPINELRKASNHLDYEIWMLRITSHELEKHALQQTISKESELQSHTHANYSELITHTDHSMSNYSSNYPVIPPSESESSIAQINAFIESFTIHLRCLLNFFYMPTHQAHKEDVLAEHFFDDPADWYE